MRLADTIISSQHLQLVTASPTTLVHVLKKTDILMFIDVKVSSLHLRE